MAYANHGGRQDQSSDEDTIRVEALRNRVDALEFQSRQSQREQHEAEGREQNLRKHNQVLARLSLSRTLAEGDAEDAYREICIAAAEALNIDRVGVWFFDDGEATLRAMEVYDRRRNEHSCDHVLDLRKYPRYFAALCLDRALAADDVRNDPRTSELNDAYLIPCGITSMLDAPVRIEGRVVGAICHEHVGPRRTWTIDEQTFAGSMGDFVALTLQAERRREAEREILRQREFLRQIIDISPNIVSVVDREGRFVFVNHALAEIAGISRNELIGRNALELVDDAEQGARLRRIDQEILEGREEDVVSVEEFRDAEGKGKWYQIVKRPIRAMDGRERQVLSVAVDITERKQYEDRLAMLVRELDHRVKNNLFAVMIMAEQTAASVESLEEFVPTFNGRIRSISIAHELLAASNWQGASIAELLERMAQPYMIGDTQRIAMRGPDVLLPPPVAPALCMMLNELLSNAAEYGSLSTAEGRVDVSWDVAAGKKLHLRWVESAGPKVSKPQKDGFGIELIERTARHQLRGEAELLFDESGLRCELGIPLESAPRREKPAQPPEN